MARLDIVICTYNRAADLERCLDVLRHQTAPRGWRVTVIDNNSTDTTPQVVQNYAAAGALPDLMRTFEPKPGLTAARQRAMRDSRSEWVAFVDDDCLLHPDWISSALATLEAHPKTGALGGRVVPDWGRPAPSYLDRNGWLFAHQDFGSTPCEVDSLVGAGLIVNRLALGRTGWTAEPLLSDRIGHGFVSGGDVEISLRLRAAGNAIRYEPAMHLDHMIARDRQAMSRLIGLAAGLGGGAALASLLTAGDFATWLKVERGEIRAARHRHRLALGHVLRLRYDLRDWRIFDAFLAGRHDQLSVIAADAEAFCTLAGACRPLA